MSLLYALSVYVTMAGPSVKNAVIFAVFLEQRDRAARETRSWELDFTRQSKDLLTQIKSEETGTIRIVNSGAIRMDLFDINRKPIESLFFSDTKYKTYDFNRRKSISGVHDWSRMPDWIDREISIEEGHFIRWLFFGDRSAISSRYIIYVQKVTDWYIYLKLQRRKNPSPQFDCEVVFNRRSGELVRYTTNANNRIEIWLFTNIRTNVKGLTANWLQTSFPK